MRSRLLGAVAATALVGAAAAGCGLVASPTPVEAVTAEPAVSAPTSRIDVLATIARSQYDREVAGAKVQALLHRVATDAGLRRALRSRDHAAVRAYVTSRFATTWYHWHISRVRVSAGGRVLAEQGVPFVVAGPSIGLRGLGRVQISLQDEIGFVRLMHRNHHVHVVVRGQTRTHVRSSLPGATRRPLPTSGTTVVAKHRYAVRAIHERAWNGEPVTIWLLAQV